MRLVSLEAIQIAPDRQRKEIEASALNDLATSISSIGLIHPIVVKEENAQVILVAGERRLRAVDLLSGLGQTFMYGGSPVPDGKIPCTYLRDLDPLDAMEIELEENIRREDLTWQDRSTASAQLFELRRLQAEKRGETPPTAVEFSKEVYPDFHPGAASTLVREELILARYLKDPDVSSASTAKEGMKVIRRKEEASRNAALGEAVGLTFSARDHVLLRGDCLDLMKNIYAKYDCILTDPPYGINAQDFNDSDGKAAGGHSYDDSFDSWSKLMHSFVHLAYSITKPQAHAYIFCDVDNFKLLRDLMSYVGWKPFRTPLVWHNPTSQRAPWPHCGPHRRYQLCLYAVKGDRPCLKLAPDLVTYASDTNLGWAAQKPIALYSDLLARTCRPGDSVLDPFCGSGTVFPAAHEMKVKATGIEMDATAYGISAQRLEALK